MDCRLHQSPSRVVCVLLVGAILLAGCSGIGRDELGTDSPEHLSAGDSITPERPDVLALPALEPAEMEGRPLRVVATTSIVGDIVRQVGGDAIDLFVMMAPGQDPHSYQPSARTLSAAADAKVIFVNGWELEEGLIAALDSIGEHAPLVPVSAGIVPLLQEGGEGHSGAEDDGDHGQEGAVDPHVWFSVSHVLQWVDNVEQVLSQLDPANAETYARNAAAYRGELNSLQSYASETMAKIPAAKRYLVTTHDSLSYLARDYDLEILGTVIPSTSTVAEPSASDLADLIAGMDSRQVCTIFTEATINATLANTVAAELEACDQVHVLQLYTGALGPAGSGADSYTGMFRANVDTIVEGLSATTSP